MKVVTFMSTILHAYSQGKMPVKSSVKMQDETTIQYCMFNDFEKKENQVVEFGFEGLTKPGKGLEI